MNKDKPSLELRGELLARPVIIVNDVTYRSPEDMPEDAREIWDRYTQQLEQLGIDWREQDRVVLTWSREGGASRQSFNMERRSVHLDGRPAAIDELRRRFEGMFATKGRSESGVGARRANDAWRPGNEGLSENKHGPAIIDASSTSIESSRSRRALAFMLLYVVLCVLPLLVYGAQAHEPQVLVAFHGVLFCASFVLLWLPILWWAVKSGWRWNRTLDGLALPLTLLIFISLACFFGVPKLLHRMAREPGDVTLTVSHKRTGKGKRIECNPRLAFEGFAGDVCFDYMKFNCVKVGDRIRIKGQVSAYAVEADEFEFLTEEAARCTGWE